MGRSAVCTAYGVEVNEGFIGGQLMGEYVREYAFVLLTLMRAAPKSNDITGGARCNHMLSAVDGKSDGSRTSK